MQHEINIRIPSNANLNQLDPTKFQKSTKGIGSAKITVLTYNDKVPKSRLEKISQKISDFFSGVKDAKNSLTLVKAWSSLGEKANHIFVGGKSQRPSFNTNLIPTKAQELQNKQQAAIDTLTDQETVNNKFVFTLTRFETEDKA